MKTLLVTMTLTLTACSLYESQGRKTLESGLGTLGVSVQSNVQSCNRTPETQAEWLPQQETIDADVYTRAEVSQLRVIPKSDPTYHCDYQFSSSDEMTSKTDVAISYTLKAAATP